MEIGWYNKPNPTSCLKEVVAQDTFITYLTTVNLTNVLDEGLRIGEIGRRMNSKVKSVKQDVYRK
jgi:hypothetical protein